MDEPWPLVAEWFAAARIVPVLTIDDADRAASVARALAEGGLRLIEVTLRTGAALAAVHRIARAVPECRVGVGTLREPEEAARAKEAGAAFAVSPGLSERLATACAACALPYLPGVATASEIMRAVDIGFRCLKFFPASAGGVAALQAFAAPFPDVAFCPTGGIDAATAAGYLALPNVIAVGGSWMAPRDAIAAGGISGLTDAARAACALANSTPAIRSLG
ncbi:MAG: bifunctional 4-hydroxy-2-oxoglutarate aldolase/2-dehydro-3-deoxy-phosphogluconate aldolase [Alphaproteobacteria bacterium]|nr:bifunctional 4-hydroxy-2-oxoglutarate aldolase/2-dehydro-3-deoxy-phosphogluconate aldolase [Alphaproteobacteria bacterium]